MTLNFPANPTTNDFYQDANATYQWNGDKWRRTDVLASAIVTEYSDIIEQESSSVSIDLEKYNYFKIEFTSNLSISFPTASAHSNIILELNREYSNTGYTLSPGVFSISGQDFDPADISFKPDGTKMYVVGFSGNDVIEYDLSYAWDISSAVYLQNFSVNSQDNNPRGIFIKPDGTKMYIAGDSTNSIIEYDLSTAWDVSSAAYLQNFNVTSQDTSPHDVFFKPDGTKMYVVGQGNNRIYEYDLSTAWDVTSATLLHFRSAGGGAYDPSGIFFKPDGTKMYIVDHGSDQVDEYNLSTAWNVSNATYGQNFSVSSQDNTPTGIFFKPDGVMMYVVGGQNDSVHQYGLDTAWDISSVILASYDNVSFSVGSQDNQPRGIFFKPDGTKMYIVGDSGDDINEYNLSTAWDVSSAAYLQNFSLNSQDTSPSDVFIRPDGIKMYIVGFAQDRVYEYDLSTAWDISSASFLQNFSVSSQENDPVGIFFKPDGVKMYVVGDSGNAIYEYNLSTAWDVSSAAYLQNISVNSRETNPSSMFFKPDGNKMYVLGTQGRTLDEYNLSTAWDISSAVYRQEFSVVGQDYSPSGVFFKPDGVKMYIVGRNNNTVYQYSTGAISAPVISWSNNILWKDGIAPPLDLTVSTNILINFITYDGAEWIGSQLSTDSRSV
jgi:DNA-binding beta-propeller fold protein YncE